MTCETKSNNMYSEELANKVRQIISDISINKANLQHIAEHGKINGSLHVSLYDIIYKYEAERSELRNKVIEEAVNKFEQAIREINPHAYGSAYESVTLSKVIDFLNSLKTK